MTRDALLALPDDSLLRLCRVDRCRGTGPGGQKRNKTESAVCVTHIESGISGAADETRSQHTNKALALQNLRLALALKQREPTPRPWPHDWCPGKRDVLFPQWLARVCDVLAVHEYRVSEAAAFFQVSTGRFVRDLSHLPALWQELNRQRRLRQMSPLRADS